MRSLPCPSTRAVGRAAALPSLQTKRIKTDGRRHRSLSSARPSPPSPSTFSLSALPAFLADLPPPALAAAAATAAAAAASAATRFALLSAVDFAVATRLSAAVAPLRDPKDPSSDRKRALLLPSAGRDGRGDGSRQGSRDLFLLPDRVGECVAGEKKKKKKKKKSVFCFILGGGSFRVSISRFFRTKASPSLYLSLFLSLCYISPLSLFLSLLSLSLFLYLLSLSLSLFCVSLSLSLSLHLCIFIYFSFPLFSGQFVCEHHGSCR